MKRLFYFILASVLFLAFSSVNSALAESNGIVINEIAWMGTTVSANDEWIELYNSTEQAVNLDDWILKTADNKLNIKLSGNIASGGFYLLERTDDESVPAIAADLIYSGALANDGEHLQLYDATSVLIDEGNYADNWLAENSANIQAGWPAGDNTTKQTMERVGAGWQTSQNPGGTPKSTSSSVEGTQIEVVEQSAKLVENSSLPILSYPTGIVINEVLPSPDGADETEEWIALTIQLISSVCS